MAKSITKKPVWKLQDAKAQFSKVVRDAIEGEPQYITRRGENAVVILSIEEFEKLVEKRPSLAEYLLKHTPKVADFHVERGKQPLRKIEL